MKTTQNWSNRQMLLSETPKPVRTANQYKLRRQVMSFHETENWNDEHIIKYRNHLKDVRDLRSKWQISDGTRVLNASTEEKARSDIQNFEISMNQQTSCERTTNKPNTRRPCSSKQSKWLQQIRQIYSFQQSSNRQNKMKLFLQADNNYMNCSFRYYRNFTNYLNQLK